MRRLLVRRVARVVVWAGGGGGRCCVRGPVMGFPLVAAERGGSGRRVGGGRGQWGLVGASVRVGALELEGGSGGGEGVWGWHYRGGGCQLCTSGVRVCRRVLSTVCVCVERVMRPPVGRAVEVGGGCLGFWVGVQFTGGGRLLVGGACRQGLRLRRR